MSAAFLVPPLVPPRRRLRAARASSPARMSASSPDAVPALSYGRIQHAGVLVRDTQVAKRFYMAVFGMADDDHLRNPKLPFNGAFLRAGASQIHLMELPSPDPLEGRPEHGGRDRHVAVTVNDLQPLIASLQRHHRPFTFSKSGRRALFTRDLDSNAIEFIEDTSV
ncbi:hypothetical protein BWQ96_04858 [Gracilariopsis chorda]|uniref:VOC domain-containing protein n=1 Tax=Gracilariopsis chorda TaxID=448386 RepID=A0A2V3IT82_9FLOR|nr:hypothetical protein BWQ96_04858 [Gracilariopsis chorda]|eukprot:PXF45338.1 hypothetical protein BWQ96_04858 [Gracilariopsis chorda]